MLYIVCWQVEELLFQLVCDPSGVVVETTLKELVPAVINWGNKLDHILRVSLSHILSSAQVCCFSSIAWSVIREYSICSGLYISHVYLKIAALSTSFGGWRIHGVTSSSFGRTRTMECWCFTEIADRIASPCAQESTWDMPTVLRSWNIRNNIFNLLAWVVCRVSAFSPWIFLLIN